MGKIIGIDISKQTFDVCFKEEKALIHKIFDNNEKGFKRLWQLISKLDTVVMEASGPYYMQLANYLYSKKIKVCVLNPLIIRRFSQMRFYRAKTDKKDASVILEYGYFNKEELQEWKPNSTVVHALQQQHTCLELLRKQQHQVKRQLEAFSTTGNVSAIVKESLEEIIISLELKIKEIEQHMLLLCKDQYQETYELLTSIPGIGNKTAIMLIVITDNFKKFTHYKKLIAYVGFSPRIYQSGTSVKGKGHICKMGKPQIRKLLYLCSWSAKKCNQVCKQMYERLKSKGKPERVIKIALANKLLKQAFAIATSKQKYLENYNKNICF